MTEILSREEFNRQREIMSTVAGISATMSRHHATIEALAEALRSCRGTLEMPAAQMIKLRDKGWLS